MRMSKAVFMAHYVIPDLFTHGLTSCCNCQVPRGLEIQTFWWRHLPLR